MEVTTNFGRIVTREFASSLQRSSSVFLKDNMSLVTLFSWLKNMGIMSISDAKHKLESVSSDIEGIRFNYEVLFYVNEDIPMIVFHNIAPSIGDFQIAIPAYLNLLYRVMYNVTTMSDTVKNYTFEEDELVQMIKLVQSWKKKIEPNVESPDYVATKIYEEHLLRRLKEIVSKREMSKLGV